MEDLARATAAVDRALRERDENTSAHSGRTCGLALETGQACGLSDDDLATLKLAAQLHDVGKIGIPDRVLLKPGRLDDEEMRVMRTHPRRGHDILASIGGERIATVATVVLHHHEAVDGSGYPDGIRDGSIPLLSRIVSIADSYDAIATVRPYHRPRPHEEIMRILYEAQGRKYDAEVLATFARVIERSVYRAGVDGVAGRADSLPATRPSP
jgi:HD-GYP domain-containing protein (c-di-GMP phosphodiesterase class II)